MSEGAGSESETMDVPVTIRWTGPREGEATGLVVLAYDDGTARARSCTYEQARGLAEQFFGRYTQCLSDGIGTVWTRPERQR